MRSTTAASPCAANPRPVAGEQLGSATCILINRAVDIVLPEQDCHLPRWPPCTAGHRPADRRHRQLDIAVMQHYRWRAAPARTRRGVCLQLGHLHGVRTGATPACKRKRRAVRDQRAIMRRYGDEDASERTLRRCLRGVAPTPADPVGRCLPGTCAGWQGGCAARRPTAARAVSNLLGRLSRPERNCGTCTAQSGLTMRKTGTVVPDRRLRRHLWARSCIIVRSTTGARAGDAPAYACEAATGSGFAGAFAGRPPQVAPWRLLQRDTFDASRRRRLA